jgi:hypothetical protein
MAPRLDHVGQYETDYDSSKAYNDNTLAPHSKKLKKDTK